MKKITAIITAVLLASVLSYQTAIAQTPETRSVGNFSGVSFSGAYEVTLQNSNETKVIVTGSEDVPNEDIVTEVKGNMLHVRFKDNKRHRNIRQSPKIVVYYKNLDCIENSGAVNLKNEGTLKCNSLKIDVSGAGNINLNLETEKLNVDVSGAGNITLQGKATSQNYDMSGTSNIKAFDLVGQNVSMDISGTSNAKVHAKNSLDVDISGTGAVRYRGNPSNVRSSDSRTSSVKAE
jgi:Putative auto-transporter adhesin, head GIN domain